MRRSLDIPVSGSYTFRFPKKGIDGEKVRYWKREFLVAPGCHAVEAEVAYEVDMYERPDNICLGFAPRGQCRQLSDYETGRVPFAINVQAGKRYELTALADGDALRVYFVEIDPSHGTVAWFPPAYDSKSCKPGFPWGVP